MQQSIFGQFVNVTLCDRCNGEGQVISDPCVECHGQGVVRAKTTVQIDVPQGADWYQRTMRAHMNCVENLPVFAAIVLSAYALGRPGVADGVASYVLGARLAQSTVHLIGVNHWLVFVRGTLFTIQVVLFLYMIR